MYEESPAIADVPMKASIREESLSRDQNDRYHALKYTNRIYGTIKITLAGC